MTSKFLSLLHSPIVSNFLKFSNYYLRPVKFFISGFLVCISVYFANAQKAEVKSMANEELKFVKPIDWSRFTSGKEKTPQQDLIEKILLNTNKYALTNWWEKRGFTGTPINDYLDLKGVTEHKIRPIAAEAEALAISLKTGLYNETVTGVTKKEAEAKTIQLIRSLSHSHLANKSGGWGRQWQSALWAGYTANAAWIMWNDLDNNTRIEVLAMTQNECNWIMSNKGKPELKTYRDRNGKIISPGDTGAEENAWDASIIGIAASMMPQSLQKSVWMNKLISLSLNAMARPGDLQNRKKYNGKPLNEWLVGSNINEDGTVVNHHFIHPDYMTSPSEFNLVKYFGLAKLPILEASKLNTDVVFHAFADLKFKTGDSIIGGRVKAPGGTIFKPGSGAIFYPLGTDWGEGRKMNFAMFNCLISILTDDADVKKRALDWELRQAQIVLDMQSRFSDGHTYLDKSEDNYASCEEWVANKSSTAYILELLRAENKIKFTNKGF